MFSPRTHGAHARAAPAGYGDVPQAAFLIDLAREGGSVGPQVPAVRRALRLARGRR